MLTTFLYNRLDYVVKFNHKLAAFQVVESKKEFSIHTTKAAQNMSSLYTALSGTVFQ